MESSSEGETSLLCLLNASADAFSASNITILFVIILLLLLMTAITAGSETAYFSLTAKDINYLKTKDQPTARQVIRLLDYPKMLLATIVVANSFINIAIVITTNLIVTELVPPETNPMLWFLIQIVGVTFVLVLIGEVLPKVYATQNSMRMALFCAPVLVVLSSIFRPVSKMLVSSTKYIEKRLNTKTNNNISSEDFEHAIELTVGHSASKQEVNIFKGILKFGNISVKQIMRTRLDVGGLPYDITFPEVQERAIELGYSRLPVYQESLDKVVGVVHTKDFLPHVNDVAYDWHELMRPTYFVHEGKLIEDLLKEFQQKRIHMAVVVDEFGGTSGIVTLEDIMEEIIGDIRDEFDEDDVQYKKIDDNNYLFEGKTLINDVCRLIGLSGDTFDEVRDESDSLAGLILEIAGKFPAVNEMVSYKNFDFTVLNLDKMRIQRVKLTIREEQTEEEEEA